MPKISINIITKNRASFLARALESISRQSYLDFEIVTVNDGSRDNTSEILSGITIGDKIKIINHENSLGIVQSRQEVLEASAGEYVAILDDDDEWLDLEKLQKQSQFLDQHPDYVLVGGGIKTGSGIGNYELRLRPESDRSIRNWMLLKNPFFTSTVMFRRETAIKAGGFIKDEIDLAEDYDLWLRLGKAGKMVNLKEPLTLYRKNDYNKEKHRQFLKKQLKLAKQHKANYPFGELAVLLLKIRLLWR